MAREGSHQRVASWDMADASTCFHHDLTISREVFCSAQWFKCKAVVHSITSSARARIDGGMVKPSDFAVLRLMSRSSRVDHSTGNSAASRRRESGQRSSRVAGVSRCCWRAIAHQSTDMLVSDGAIGLGPKRRPMCAG
jgi:hypothetical protein